MAEHGRWSRRRLLLALPSLAIARRVFAQTRTPSLRATVSSDDFDRVGRETVRRFLAGALRMPIQAAPREETVCSVAHRIGTAVSGAAAERRWGDAEHQSVFRHRGPKISRSTIHVKRSSTMASNAPPPLDEVQIKVRDGIRKYWAILTAWSSSSSIRATVAAPGGGERGDVHIPSLRERGLLTLRDLSQFTVFAWSDGGIAAGSRASRLSIRAKQGPAAAAARHRSRRCTSCSGPAAVLLRAPRRPPGVHQPCC